MKLSVPANGWLSEGFGPRDNPRFPNHLGVDFGWLTSAPDFRIFAAAPGVVTRVAFSSLLGNQISIRHDDGTSTDYWHLATRGLVNVGDRVGRRQHIATMGSTGTSASGQRHLHFNYWVDGVRVDPMPFMAGTAADGGVLFTEDEKEDEDMAQPFYYIAASNNATVTVGTGDIWVRSQPGEPLRRLTAGQAQDYFARDGLDYNSPNVVSREGEWFDAAFAEDAVVAGYNETVHPWMKPAVVTGGAADDTRVLAAVADLSTRVGSFKAAPTATEIANTLGAKLVKE